jgi:hypothetical protein
VEGTVIVAIIDARPNIYRPVAAAYVTEAVPAAVGLFATLPAIQRDLDGAVHWYTFVYT